MPVSALRDITVKGALHGEFAFVFNPATLLPRLHAQHVNQTLILDKGNLTDFSLNSFEDLSQA